MHPRNQAKPAAKAEPEPIIVQPAYVPSREQQERDFQSTMQQYDPYANRSLAVPPLPAPAPIAVELASDEPTGTFTLAEWAGLSSTEQAALLALRHQPTTKRFNEQNGQDNIEWARWSWNPVTGCKHNCIYCYARDIAERFYPQKFEPSIIPERLAVPYTQQPPEGGGPGYRNVFTCSMADLWGRWVPQAWIDAVLATVTENPQWNFLMLTKFPGRMAEQAWPANAWVGTSVDTQARVAAAEKAFANVKAGVKWLSCEPMLEPLQFSSLAMFDWVVIGGQTRRTQAPEFQPKWEWIEDLLWQARQAGCKVYFKTNLLNRPREYPTD
jgi:protein gp37